MTAFENNLLPGGNSFVKDEALASSRKIPATIMTFYINSHLAVTNKRFLAHFPNIVLWVFPLGFENVNMPIRQISTVTLQMKYYPLRLAIGTILIISSLQGASIFLLLIGIVLFGSGISPCIFVGGAGSEKITIPVVFWKKTEARKLVWELNRIVVEHS